MAIPIEFPARREDVGWVEGVLTGVMRTRVFQCSKTDLVSVLSGELLVGVVLKALWGGVATSNVEDPRLMEPVEVRSGHGALMVELVGKFLEITPTGNRATGYIECAGARRPGPDDVVGLRTVVVGMAPTAGDGGWPAVGSFLDGGSASNAATLQKREFDYRYGGRVIGLMEYQARVAY